MAKDYLAANRKLWDARTPIHVASDFYDVAGFKAGRESLHAIEIEEVGDVRGSSLLHLQCHFGQDTISWARRGATVTGVDFSKKAIASAKRLAKDCDVDARFLVSDIYALDDVLDDEFDVVFTSYGVLAWLGDLTRWAEIAAAHVRRGGFFYIAEIHPMPQTFADDADEPLLGYPYFSTGKPIRFHEKGTYADPWADIELDEYYWPHGLGEIVSALAATGLQIEFLHEHAMTVYPQFGYLERDDEGWWRFPATIPSVPLLFSLRARKPS